MRKLGITVHLNAKVLGLDPSGASLRVERDDGNSMRVPGDKFLVAVGRRPRLEGFGLEDST